jgi:hypothetical protein
MAQATHTAPVLVLHQGGVDPDELRAICEAERVLRELADAMPASDRLYESITLLAEALGLRQDQAELRAIRAELRAIQTEFRGSLPLRPPDGAA